MIVDVRFAPKATVANQNVIRRFVPQTDSCTQQTDVRRL
jgi:hypothetical protein